MAGADQPLSPDSLGDPPEPLNDPVHSSRQVAPRGAPCVLELSGWQRQRDLQGLRLFWIWILVRREGHQHFLLFFDECKMPTDWANDCVSYVSIAADQRFDQTVVAEHMSAAQGPLSAGETLIAHWTLVRVLLAIILVQCHRGNKTPIATAPIESKKIYNCTPLGKCGVKLSPSAVFLSS